MREQSNIGGTKSRWCGAFIHVHPVPHTCLYVTYRAPGSALAVRRACLYSVRVKYIDLVSLTRTCLLNYCALLVCGIPGLYI